MSSKPIAQQLQDEINAVIKNFKYGEITFCEAVGVLEIIKMDLWISQNDETREFKNPNGFNDGSDEEQTHT